MNEISIRTSELEAKVLDRKKNGLPSPGRCKFPGPKWRTLVILESTSQVRKWWIKRLRGGLVQYLQECGH